MLTISAKNALDVSPIDKQLFGEQYLNRMKDAAAADKLVKSLTTQNTPTTKPKLRSSGKSHFQTRPPLQGNARVFTHRLTSCRRAKTAPRSTRQRSNSRSRNNYYRR